MLYKIARLDYFVKSIPSFKVNDQDPSLFPQITLPRIQAMRRELRKTYSNSFAQDLARMQITDQMYSEGSISEFMETGSEESKFTEWRCTNGPIVLTAQSFNKLGGGHTYQGILVDYTITTHSQNETIDTNKKLRDMITEHFGVEGAQWYNHDPAAAQEERDRRKVDIL